MVFLEHAMRQLMAPLLLATLPAATIAVARDACDPSNLGQQAMTTCAGWDFEKAEAKLVALFKEQLNAEDNAETKALLVRSQKAWVVYRDAECDYAASASLGGSIYPMLVSQCQTHLTEARMKELRDDLICEGGFCGNDEK
jgi:uncharacterized protein YecT (DUF1311 family)